MTRAEVDRAFAVWRALQARGVTVIGFSERDHLAAALVERDGQRGHSSGYTLADALERAAKQLDDPHFAYTPWVGRGVS